MGNQLLKKYNIDKENPMIGGYNNYWKIYKGVHKERKKDASVFVFEKKKIEKLKKDQREEIVNILKKESQQLMKFKHPNILCITEPLVEDKDTLVFISEPVNYTLNSWLETMNPSKLEIKTLIKELCSTIYFLHQDAKLIHLSICPENIFIDNQGHVKISGFNFSLTDPQKKISEIKLYNFNVAGLPNLKYIAPEIVYESKVGYFSDIFSIGVLIHNILKINKGEPEELINIVNNNSINSIDNYKKCYDQIKNKIENNNLFDNQDDNEILRNCLEHVYEERLMIRDIMELKWFNDPKLKGLKFIENLEINEISKNIEFLNNFPNIISSFEDKILEKKIFPRFIDALKIENLVIHLLPPIFTICEEKKFINFEIEVWPSIKRLFKMKQINAQALYYILKKSKFITESVSNNEISTHMNSVFCKALDSGVAKIQMIVLDNMQYIIKKMDSLVFKTKFFPRLSKIIENTNSISIKDAILKVFKSVYHLLDQIIINDNLLSSLEKVRKSENNNEISMSIVDVYEEIAKVVSLESIANKVLPNLIGILVSGNISKSNFDIIMNLVQKYLTRIKVTREKDLIIDNDKSQNKEITTTNIIKDNSDHQKDFLNVFFVEKNSENGKENKIENTHVIKKDEEDKVKSNADPKEIINGQSNATKPLPELIPKDNILNNKFNFPELNQPMKKKGKNIDDLFNEFVMEDNKYFNPVSQFNKDDFFQENKVFPSFEKNNLFNPFEENENLKSQNGNDKFNFASFNFVQND